MGDWYGTVALFGAVAFFWVGVRVKDWWVAQRAGTAPAAPAGEILDQAPSTNPQLSAPAPSSPPRRGRVWGRGGEEGGEEGGEDPGKDQGRVQGSSGEEPIPRRFDTAPDGTAGVWLRPGGGDDKWR